MIQCCKPIGSEILAQGYQRTSMSRSTIILDEGLRMADGKPAEQDEKIAPLDCAVMRAHVTHNSS